MGIVRTFDAFFTINSDMLQLKKQLLDELNKEILVVLPFSQSHAQGNEIKLALNCWKKFCTFKYHFAVIGEFEQSLIEEFPWVDFIYIKNKEKKLGQYNPHLDIQHKMEIAYDHFKDKYDGFIYMVDDNYAIKPFSFKDINTIYYHQPTFIGRKDLPTSYWKHDKWKTRQLMDRENFTHINYTTHFPCYFEFERLKNLWDKFNMREESYVPEDVYFNSFAHKAPILDDNIRLGIWSKEIFDNKFADALQNPNIKFICNSVEGWSKELEDALWKIINED